MNYFPRDEFTTPVPALKQCPRHRNRSVAKSHDECISGDVLFLLPLNHQRRLIGEFVLIYIHLKAVKDGAVYLFQY